MPRKLNYNGQLIHPTTGEIITCGIRSRMVYRHGKTVYWNINLIPLDSSIGKLVPELNKREEERKERYKKNGWDWYPDGSYLTREVDPKLHKHPFLLVWVNEKKKVPVRFVSCWYRGPRHVNIRVREINGLEYCDLIPKGEVPDGSSEEV